MGSEINDTRFSREQFQAFAARLKTETELLKTWWREGRLSDEPPRAGLELEAWLVDEAGRPAPRNDEVLARVEDCLVGPELSQYNLEFNSTPRSLAGRPFSAMAEELARHWRQVNQAAAAENCRLAMIGILPTLVESDLTLEHMSRRKRYHALNEQIMRLRNRQPLKLEIDGEEPLSAEHGDVMIEAAGTSLQLHLQAPPKDIPRYFNASVMASAATVAVAANAPFLFGHRLWEETRVPVFQQSCAVSARPRSTAERLARVTFGSGYGRDALYGFFVENRQHYSVLLPELMDEPVEQLAHLRLHNGTIWRWNRPLVGFDESGRPHLRIEHRVMAAGPTVADIVANAAFYYGLAFGLADSELGPDQRLPFHLAEQNFYAAARRGLQAEVVWFGGDKFVLSQLILQQLLPVAAHGLALVGVDADEAQRQLAVIEARVRSGGTGAAWQSAYVRRYGRDFAGLVRRYLENQEAGAPVHEWPV